MGKFYEIGGYIQKVWDDGNITCTCPHGTIYGKNYKQGGTICKHIRQILINKNEPKPREKKTIRKIYK